MIKVVTAPELYDLKENEISVFLAGGISNCPDWQKEVIERLSNDDKLHGITVVIFNPRRDVFDFSDKEASLKQVSWEFNYLSKCDVFSMFFCDAPSVQPICFYELGRNIMSLQWRFDRWIDHFVLTVERGFSRIRDVDMQVFWALTDSDSYWTACAPGKSLLSIPGTLDDHAKSISESIRRINRYGK